MRICHQPLQYVAYMISRSRLCMQCCFHTLLIAFGIVKAIYMMYHHGEEVRISPVASLYSSKPSPLCSSTTMETIPDKSTRTQPIMCG